MSDQPQPSPSRLPKWLPTFLMVIGGLTLLVFIGLTLCIKTLDWPGPIPWRMLGGSFICLTIGLCLRAKAKPGS
ncbi:MAG: hypothetical protein ABMA26_13035 [Limisphaerales bacterium]